MPLKLIRFFFLISQKIISLYFSTKRVNEVDLILNDIIFTKKLPIIAILIVILTFINTFVLFILRIYTIQSDKDLEGSSYNFQSLTRLNLFFDAVIILLEMISIFDSFLIYNIIIYFNEVNDKYFIEINQMNIIRNNQQNHNRNLSNIYRLNILNRNVENNRIFKKELIMVDQNGEYFCGSLMGKNLVISNNDNKKLFKL